MKFLHLSDLHIGKTVNGFSMMEEQRHAFKQIITYIDTEKPDAVLIAGDVYDRAVPSVEAVRLFDDFLTELAAKDVAVILISGNHDSPERLNYASRLLEERKLYLCGVFDGALRHVTLTDEYGSVTFWLLPFIRPSGVRGMFPDREIETYTDAISAVLESAALDNTKRNVLLSHQFYTLAGFTPMRSESELNPIGGLDGVDASILSQFDYVALGHLHGSQRVSETIRYAGSPVKYSFSECRHTKSVLLVELKEKKNIEIKPLLLTPLRDMREIKGPLETLLSDEVSSQGNRQDYLRVTLTDEEMIIDPMGKIRSVYPNVMALNFENQQTRLDNLGPGANMDRVEQLSHYDLFQEFYLELTGSAMSAQQTQIVRELLETEAES